MPIQLFLIFTFSLSLSLSHTLTHTPTRTPLCTHTYTHPYMLTIARTRQEVFWQDILTKVSKLPDVEGGPPVGKKLIHNKGLIPRKADLINALLIPVSPLDQYQCDKRFFSSFKLIDQDAFCLSEFSSIQKSPSFNLIEYHPVTLKQKESHLGGLHSTLASHPAAPGSNLGVGIPKFFSKK